MSLIAFLNSYLTLNACLMIAALGAAGLSVITQRVGGFGLLLRAAYGWIALAILGSLAVAMIPRGEFHVAPMSEAIGSSEQGVPATRVVAAHGSRGMARAPVVRVDSWGVGVGLSFLILLGFVAGAARFFRAWRDLRGLMSRGLKLHRIGHVEVRVSSEVKVPFALRTIGGAWIILPEWLFFRPDRPGDALLALRHEMQHHRQGDTLWVYLFELLRAFCFWNPAIRPLIRSVGEIQEFACDEGLVGRTRISARAYARCLLEVAQNTLETRRLPVGTTGMAARSSGKSLERRIHRMLEQGRSAKNGNALKPLVAAMAGALAIAIGLVSYASGDVIRDRNISRQQVETWIRSLDGEFPVDAHQEVIDQLNRYVGTPQGREHMRVAIARMSDYRAVLDRKFAQYNAPEALLAIPLVESGFQNLPPGANSQKAAGLWQFIASTARNYGLRLKGNRDERLQPERATDAAMRYLAALKLRFHDWRLAVLAYNSGESRVQKGINKIGSRDPWKLIAKGYDNDRGYLAKVMAGAIVLKNPSLLD